MSDKPKTIKWLEKLKNVKHIEIYIGIIFVVIILLIFMSTKKSISASGKVVTNDMSVAGYINSLERDLEESLSNIAGVSDVKVLITLDLTKLTVKDDEVVMTTFPEIKGVLITAKGVNVTNNKLKVLHAVEAVMDISNSNIEILSSE